MHLLERSVRTVHLSMLSKDTAKQDIQDAFTGKKVRKIHKKLWVCVLTLAPRVLFFFSFFKKKLNFQFFCLSDRFLSSSRKLVSATVFSPKFFSPAAGWLIYELNLGTLFSFQAVWKTLLPVSSVFQTAFWVKKEKSFGKNTVAKTSFPDEERKLSLRQKNWLFIYKKMERWLSR